MGASVGEAAPDFNMLDQDGKAHSLSEYRGQQVVVYFYPKDDTPGCTKEACSIRDDFEQFTKNGIKVFGVSYDDKQSHKKFAEKYDIPFSLLSDSDKSVSKAYGAGGIFFPSRKTYLINAAGILIKIYENVDVTTHGAQILADFKGMATPVKD
ncbi:MAG: peroxiredoxin [Candidatus Marinimicrobia bacterium]|nr:peroxiredoxin [Candidatus Neomarinimicrobiota bacterium]MBT3632454.1 peroxiredoxin [Candidatus Neomarinimicrobiota bacterium]MBT3826041.1 peroxiredoxin [Candidatus Neomarinimicrobiota bacterium]MBT4132277.1 peroxiredoxin [Candidatus Neomarinimicrobiota bacterium]MBT4296562.1 peroxiredoxin [Candidatus Neomarinimicrobiota bacterium]